MNKYLKRFEHNDELFHKLHWVIAKWAEIEDKEDALIYNNLFKARIARTKIWHFRSIDSLPLYEQVIETRPIENLHQLCQIIAELEFGVEVGKFPDIAKYIDKKVDFIVKHINDNQ